MFDHLSYLLENSGIGLGEISHGLDSYPQLHNKFEASLSYMRLCLQNSTKPKKNQDTVAQTTLTDSQLTEQPRMKFSLRYHQPRALRAGIRKAQTSRGT